MQMMFHDVRGAMVLAGALLASFINAG